MDIKSIGSINSMISDTTDYNKNKITSNDFEKHLNSVLEKKDDTELKKVCKEFEGILMEMMYKQMKATVPKSGLLKEDFGNQMYQSMMDEKIVEEAVNAGGIGLGEQLYKLLKDK